MKPLTEALICIALGVLMAIAFYAAIMIDEPRRNHNDAIERWEMMKGVSHE
jgi:hypothetical protein